MTVGAKKKTTTRVSAGRTSEKKKAAPKRSRKKATKKKADSKGEGVSIGEYRQRLGAVGELLRAAMAELEMGSNSGDRVGQGAYLQVMGKAFEVLDGLSQTIEIDDLVKISKIVAEQRRAEMNARKLQLVDESAEADAKRSRAGANGTGANGTGAAGIGSRELPESFGDIVRQIYGTTLADDLNGPGGSVSGTD